MKRRRICSLLLAGSLILTSLSTSSSTWAEGTNNTTIAQEDVTEETSTDVEIVTDLAEIDDSTEQEATTASIEDVSTEDDSIEDVSTEITTEDLTTEEITSEDTSEETTTEITTEELTTEDASNEENTSDTNASTEEITEEITKDAIDTREPSFTKKVEGVSTSGLDFSSKELLVGTEDPTIFTWDTNVISMYNDVYLIRFDDVQTTENAYTYYYKIADFVSTNNTFKVADEDFVDNSTESNVADLSEINQGDDALSILNDLNISTTPDKTIALIDTGVNAKDLVDTVWSVWLEGIFINSFSLVLHDHCCTQKSALFPLLFNESIEPVQLSDIHNTFPEKLVFYCWKQIFILIEVNLLLEILGLISL